MTNYSQQPHLECNDHCIELFVGFVLEGILILIISIFGIIGNGATTIFCKCSSQFRKYYLRVCLQSQVCRPEAEFFQYP